ncbi:diaminobutyrate acetyltransferase [Mangrovimicrobium sediminis]|uniref:L-2,4-diaminobutyric acid acetyltransferase n=1 Tax=Mangrovimicrobium sediminis TaxID=2562682 RepID=A0A4Z0M150_9GAMM|nr:diaminobutyrate acetyltransferase [Haliea sp. SAOS-164]TGD73025.1 diaminobutyrate acetyltransferase [Haliea sp. SAOS-164]
MDVNSAKHTVVLRQPRPEDGAALHALIAACPPLDENSMYCNLLQCTHFAATTVVAERDGELVGAISGYLPPASPDTLFIWQVAVSAQARGEGLARRMLNHIVERESCAGVRFMETTVTDDNAASWALFESFAHHWHAPLQRSVMFERSAHFGDSHDTEFLARIGPLQRPATGWSDSARTDEKTRKTA